MVQKRRFAKHPEAVKDYQINWSDWMPADDFITSAAFTATPAGLTVESTDHTELTATVWLSGGTEGTVYAVKNTINTNGGRIEVQEIEIQVR